jgi:hypothetical protein
VVMNDAAVPAPPTIAAPPIIRSSASLKCYITPRSLMILGAALTLCAPSTCGPYSCALSRAWHDYSARMRQT